jgi:hypothetical protein
MAAEELIALTKQTQGDAQMEIKRIESQATSNASAGWFAGSIPQQVRETQ